MKHIALIAAVALVGIEVIHQMTGIDRLGVAVLLGIGFIWYVNES